MEKGKLMSNPTEFLAKERLRAQKRAIPEAARFDNLPPGIELGRPLDRWPQRSHQSHGHSLPLRGL